MKTVRVLNVSKGTILAEHAEMATTFITRLRGLLGRRRLEAGQGMVILPTDMIHTFFMAFPIDVVFLDDAQHVLKLIPHMQPNRISPLVRRGRAVVELPAGAIAHGKVEIGDQLQFV